MNAPMSATRLTLLLLSVAIGVPLLLAMMLTWERPPMASTQIGPNGLGMVEIDNPRRMAKLAALNTPPPPEDPVENDGSLVRDNPDVYSNVQVLGDLDTAQFNRLMTSITAWVVPAGWKDANGDENACAYCHNVENMASDEVYTKIVARRMLQMTRSINTTFNSHVKETGVTCYTCHRGQPIPANTWFINDGGKQAGGFAASRMGNNLAARSVGSTSLPYDPFTTLFAPNANIRVVGKQALPPATGASIQDTEKTYGLMMHMSQGLGVNCTFCHNSRQFSSWEESRPQRVTAWHGIRMVSEINTTYIDSLKDTFPANRKGPQGDVAKVNCTTCHQGISKPLNGVSMVKDYPELAVNP